MNTTPFSASVPLSRLFVAFFKVGLFGFGGPFSMLSMMETELVVRRHWLSRDEFTRGVSIGTITPGPISIASSAFYGYRLRGVIGSLAAVTGALLPSFVIILVFAASFSHFENSWIASGLSRGVGAAAVGLLLGVVFRTGQSFVKDISGCILALVAFVALAVFRVNPVYVIVCWGLLGLLFPARGGDTECPGSSS